MHMHMAISRCRAVIVDKKMRIPILACCSNQWNVIGPINFMKTVYRAYRALRVQI